MASWEEESEQIRNEFHDKINDLCDRVIRTGIRPSFLNKLRGDLRVVFANGSEYIEYRGYLCDYNWEDHEIHWAYDNIPDDAWSTCGEFVNQPDELFFLADILKAVQEITNHYRDGYPNDIKYMDGVLQ